LLRPDQVKIIARRLGVTEQDVVEMNRRLGGDVSLNTPIREEAGSGEWQDWLVDEISDQETRLAESEESDNLCVPKIRFCNIGDEGRRRTGWDVMTPRRSIARWNGASWSSER
jgi:hypothetical protein